jgi:hypothetical protein
MPVYLLQNDQSRLVSFMILTDCPDEPLPALTAREVCQVLRDAIVGRRMMVKGAVRVLSGRHGPPLSGQEDVLAGRIPWT